MKTNTEASYSALTHLSTHDQNLKLVIAKVGSCPLTPHKNYYQELVESIISQQLSVKAAATILKRFIDLFGHFPTPDEILTKDFDQIRSVGLSRQKTSYIANLAKKVIDDSVKFDHLDKLTNDQIIDELVSVKGIGVWTAHMFMIFCMGRTDVLAYGDLGIRTGIRNIYKLATLPDKTEVEVISKKYNWHPYESIACWYIWQSLENK